MEVVSIGQHMVIDPEMCHGQLTFRGTRIPVDTVMVYMAKGYSVDVIVHEWPQLSREAVFEAITLASEALHARYADVIAATRSESELAATS